MQENYLLAIGIFDLLDLLADDLVLVSSSRENKVC